MQSQWFRPTTLAIRPAEPLLHAEHALVAETLLRATSSLLDRVDPMAVVEQICRQLVDATPHIPLLWAWFGDPQSALLKPQVVLGAARGAAGELVVQRDFLTQSIAAPQPADVEPTRSFEISPLSLYAPWRHAANRYGARSVLVVPIGDGSDQRGLLALYASRPKYFEAMGTGVFRALGPLFHAVLMRSRHRQGDSVDPTLDRLTGLHNRSHAQSLIDQAWLTESAHDNRGVLLLANIDEIRRINAIGGRHVGDSALRHVAQVFSQTLRRTDLIARWRNSDILAWLPGLSNTAALATAEQLRQRVAESEPDAFEGLDVALRISIGATAVPSAHSFATALDRVDRALLNAKLNGRNCVVVARAEG